MPEPWDHIATMPGEEAKIQSDWPTVLICCIGQDFQPGVIEAMVKAAYYTHLRGWSIQVQVVHDICIQPNHGVPLMRNWACSTAVERQADYLLMLDTDFRLDDPSTIHTLLSAGKHIVAPWYDQRHILNANRAYERVAAPMLSPDQGLVPLEWIAANCLLFDSLVFRVAGTEIFPESMVTNKEEYIFQKLRIHGVKLWQQTDTRVTMLRPPTQVWKNQGQENPNPATVDNRNRMSNIMAEIHRIWAECEKA